jgi:hypothetical protein
MFNPSESLISLKALSAAVQSRIERGKLFKQQMEARLETLRSEVGTALVTTEDQRNIQIIRTQILELAKDLRDSDIQLEFSGGRRNFRRYSRRKRR